MYFPYLRGKQFELIAVRDLCSLFPNDILKTSPVIEPVKSSSTLKSSLKEMAVKGVNFNIIINPRVGDLQQKYQDIIDVLNETIQGYNNYQLGIIVDSKTERQIPALIEFVNNLNVNCNGITLIHTS